MSKEEIKLNCSKCGCPLIYTFKEYILRTIPKKKCTRCNYMNYVLNVLPSHKKYFLISHLIEISNTYPKAYKTLLTNLEV